MRPIALRAGLAGALLSVLVAGCLGSTPSPDFYTLSPASGAAGVEALASRPELGLVVGPIVAAQKIGLDLMWTGLIAGTIAYGVHRLREWQRGRAT